MSEDTKLELYNYCFDINSDIVVNMYKQEDGTYYAKADWDWMHQSAVAARFIKAVKAGDQDTVFQCIVPTEEIKDGEAVIRKLKETGDYSRILQTKCDWPDAVGNRSGNTGNAAIFDIYNMPDRRAYLATYTLKDGTYYDIYLSCIGSKAGYRVDIF